MRWWQRQEPKLFPEEIEDLEVPELEEEIPGPEEDLAVVEPGAHRFPDQVVVGEGQRPPSPQLQEGVDVSRYEVRSAALVVCLFRYHDHV